MMSTTRLTIVTPDGQIFDGDVKSATLPGEEGEFGVLAGHASLVSLLSAGVIEIEKEDGKKDMVAINWGYAKVDETTIDVLADGAVAISGDSESEIANSISDAKDLIKSASDSKMALAAVETRIEAMAKSIL
jgi:F-type H+-transporting ATPase subunit epsilon